MLLLDNGFSKSVLRTPAFLKHFCMVVALTSLHVSATHRIAVKTLMDLVTFVAEVAVSILANTYCRSNVR